MPLSADAQAALDRSVAALRGTAEAAAQAGDAVRDVVDFAALPMPGWSVLTRADRAPVVYDVTPAHSDPDTGEVVPTTYHTAALPTGDGSRGRGLERMDVTADDVTGALGPDARYIGDVLACAYRELGRGASSRDAARGARRAWVSGVVGVLEDVRRTMGWG